MIVAQTTTKDTICGMTVNPGTAIHADRDGETFYFCSDHCRQKFLFKTAAVRPEEKSAAAADTTVKRDTKAGAPASGKTIYTCPMHPEVRQDHQGACPKCGMALEPETAVAGDQNQESAELLHMTRRLWIGAALAIPVFVLAMAHLIPVLGRQSWVDGQTSRWIQFALTIPVVVWAGWPFFPARLAFRCHAPGLDAVEAEIEPAGKVAYVKKLRAEGQHVAMAGDGINDAPALSEAEVGIAMGTGTDVAMQSAGITLVKGDLRDIAKAIRLSRATMWNIRENLVFAFLYNALGIPVAAGVLYPFFGLLLSPMIAGAAMSLSSVSVIGNALRLRNVKMGASQI